MTQEELREFAARARKPVADLKAAHWRAAHAANPLAAMAAAHLAFEHARTVAAFPPPAYVEADLAHHVELKQRIDRASAALSVR